MLAELARLADGVHHLADQVFVGQAFGVATGEPIAIFGLEFLDLEGGELLEVVAHSFARFELLAVNQDCSGRSIHRPASTLLNRGVAPEPGPLVVRKVRSQPAT